MSPILLCPDCHLHFLRHDKRSKRCPACRSKRIDEQKKASQRQRVKDGRRQSPHEHFDISSEEIDARFQAALKEVRAQRSEALEPFRSYGWLYREPRS